MPPKSLHQRISEKSFDLDALAVDYQAGILAIGAICKKFKTSPDSLEKVAKSMGWVRQGMEKSVRAATQEKVLREAAERAGFRNPTRAQVVEAASRESAEIDRQHREFSSKIIDQTGRIADQIEAATDEKTLNLLVKKAQGLHYLALPRLKGMDFQRRALGLDDSPAATLQVTLGLDSPVFAGLNLRAPTKKTTNDDGGEG